MPKPKNKRNVGLKQKYAIKMRGEVPDTILPEGWIGVNHICGAIVYLHRETRVVTWSRPYVISRETSLKKHDIPLMSIPCLHQKLALGESISSKLDSKRACSNDDEPHSKSRKVDTQNTDVNENNIKDDGGEVQDNCTNNETKKTEQCPWNGVVHSDQINESGCNGMNNLEETCEIPCNGLSEETEIGNSMEIGDEAILSINGNEDPSETNGVISCSNNPMDSQEKEDVVASVNNCSDNNSENELEDLPNMVNPVKIHNYISKIFEFDLLAPDQGNVPILSYACPVEPEVIEDNNVEKKFITEGKTPFQILNEYCQKELKALPTASKIERHSQHDFTVEILIKNFKFGIAAGDTLRQAKHSAASCTLDILDSSLITDSEDEPNDYLQIFDKIPSDDAAVLPTIEEFSALDSIKYPYEILLHLLARNFGPEFEETEITFGLVDVEGSSKYVMQYKEYIAPGGIEEETAKQLAAQAFIQLLYPDLKTWGSIIRLMEAYTKLVSSRNANTESQLSKPSKCIIHVLRQEMRKIAGN